MSSRSGDFLLQSAALETGANEDLFVEGIVGNYQFADHFRALQCQRQIMAIRAMPGAPQNKPPLSGALVARWKGKSTRC